MRSTTDGASHHAEQRENHADHDQDDADRPQDRDAGQKADDQKYYAKCYHRILPGSELRVGPTREWGH
jgi:hypothetical protein